MRKANTDNDRPGWRALLVCKAVSGGAPVLNACTRFVDAQADRVLASRVHGVKHIQERYYSGLAHRRHATHLGVLALIGVTCASYCRSCGRRCIADGVAYDVGDRGSYTGDTLARLLGRLYAANKVVFSDTGVSCTSAALSNKWAGTVVRMCSCNCMRYGGCKLILNRVSDLQPTLDEASN